MKKSTFIICLITLLIALSPAIKSQIIYTDINPDTTLIASGNPFHYYYMDINQDSIIDFKLAHFAPSASWVEAEIYCQFGNNQDEAVLTSNMAPMTLTYNSPIDNTSGNWTNTVSGSSNSALFVPSGITDKYLGLRIQLSGQWHYGWAKVDVPSNTSSFTIKSFAFNTIANQAINAGDTFSMSTSIPTIEKQNDLKVYSSETHININVGDNSYLGGIATVYNLAGQEVKSVAIKQAKFNINVASLSKGLYFVSVKNNSQMQTRKVIIQ
ncbi:MAG: T9SS type A sorting domain-containing protein [Saprospiraceae bacterium]|nr:T9SS type A sorting domain-containing protein [Saprospiraceae bacterium]